MAYIYQTTFDIDTDESHRMQVGKSLGVALAYLKALLPDEEGFVTSRAMVLLNQKDLTHVVFESTWEDWDTLSSHLNDSLLTEEKIFPKFDLPISLKNLEAFIFEEVV